MGRLFRAPAPLILAVLIDVAALGVAACGGSAESAPRVSLSEAQSPAVDAPAAVSQSSGDAVAADLSPRARAALDSGNTQMREKRYVDALASYRAAVKEAPGHVAPEFGIYMAAERLGNRILADSAQRIINAHTRGSPAWTDSTMRTVHGERPLPRSHPTI